MGFVWLSMAADIVSKWAVISDEMDCIRAMFRKVSILDGYIYKDWAYFDLKNSSYTSRM